MGHLVLTWLHLSDGRRRVTRHACPDPASAPSLVDSLVRVNEADYALIDSAFEAGAPAWATAAVARGVQPPLSESA
jgi:hypothetical protein